MINFNNYWTAQTAIFLVVLIVAVFVSIRKKKESGPMPKETSNELRGLAILAVIFVHLTYGKFYGTDFLFPVGIWSGIAVSLFFFLSGYGLAASAIYHPKPIKEFFKKRVLKIYLPLWISLIIFLIIDAIFLSRTYPVSEMISSFIGFFPKADLFTSINSPLWFLTPLLLFYLVFPFVFRPKHPIISSAVLLALSFLVFVPGWPVSAQIAGFYQVHFLAFPLGAIFATMIVSPQTACPNCLRRDKCPAYWLNQKIKSGAGKLKRQKFFAGVLTRFEAWPFIFRLILMAALVFLAGYTAYNSGVGKGIWPEQLIGLFTMFCLIALFLLKRTKFVLLEIIGIYSFEIYLLHWPLIGRYDFLYPRLPAALATIIYLAIFLGLGYLLQKFCSLITRKRSARQS